MIKSFNDKKSFSKRFILRLEYCQIGINFYNSIKESYISFNKEYYDDGYLYRKNILIIENNNNSFDALIDGINELLVLHKYGIIPYWIGDILSALKDNILTKNHTVNMFYPLEKSLLNECNNLKYNHILI